MIVRDGQAPYTSTAAILQVIDRFRHRNPATPVTVEVLEMLGVGAAIAPRTLQALKLLDLLDEDGQPTDALRGLREASPADLPVRLADVMRSAYAEVFSYNDPATDPPDQLVEAFRRYNPASMRPRMVRLFYGLCSESQIITEVPSIGNDPAAAAGAKSRRSRSGEPSGEVKQTKRPAPKTGGEQRRPQDDRVHLGFQEDAGLLKHLHPALIGLLATIPPVDEPWPSRDRFDNFKTAFDATLRISNPVPSKSAGSPEE